MQTSVPGEIRWRIGLYDRCFTLCRRSEISFARLLALPVERLRLAAGDRGDRIRVPVAYAGSLTERLSGGLPGLAAVGGFGSFSDVDKLRRAVRTAQIDADLPPDTVGGWLRERAELWVSAIGSVEKRGLAEIGRGEGGLETAYLVHLALLLEVRRILDDRRMTDATRAWASSAVALAFEALTADSDDDSLPVRLALMTSVTTSPIVLGADPDAMGRRPLSAYRTHPTALRLARKVFVEPIEIIPIDRVVDTIARRLVVDEVAKADLLRAALLEMVRDACLLLFMKAADRGPLTELLASEAALTQAVFNQARRRRLEAWLREAPLEPARAKEAVLGLLAGTELVERGDPTPLGIHGDLAERAATAARGAVLLVIDSHTADVVKTATMPIERVSDDRFDEGGCYRIGDDDRPLFALAPHGDEAVLFVDGSMLAQRGFDRSAKSSADLVSRLLFEPALDVAKRIGGEGRDARCVDVDQGGIAFSGDVAVVFALAEALQAEVLKPLAERFEAQTDDALGRSSRADEITAERERLEARIAGLDRAASEKRDVREAKSLLSDGKKVLLEQLARLKAAEAEARPPPPVLSIRVTHGAPGAEVMLDGRPVWFAPALVAARAPSGPGVTISASAVDAFERAKHATLVRKSIDLTVRDRVFTYDFFHTSNRELRLVLQKKDDDYVLVAEHDPLHPHLVRTIGGRTWPS